MQQLSEAGYAAIARAGEREWHSQVTDTAKPTPATKPIAPAGGDAAHKEKMFNYHAKMLAAAKTKGDQPGVAYHSGKLKTYG